MLSKVGVEVRVRVGVRVKNRVKAIRVRVGGWDKMRVEPCTHDHELQLSSQHCTLQSKQIEFIDNIYICIF